MGHFSLRRSRSARHDSHTLRARKRQRALQQRRITFENLEPRQLLTTLAGSNLWSNFDLHQSSSVSAERSELVAGSPQSVSEVAGYQFTSDFEWLQGGGSAASQLFSITAAGDAEGESGDQDPLKVDLNGTVNTYDVVSYSTEDKTPGGYVVQDNGTILNLQGNTWKRVDLDYDVTSRTVLEFDFRTDDLGEIHAIGVDNNNSLSTSDPIFQLAGTQSWGTHQAYKDYQVSSGWKHYVIPVGEFFTGDIKEIVMVADDDAASDAESLFSNIRLYESGHTPHITSTPVTSGSEHSAYSYKVEAVDPLAGDTLTFSLDDGPSGMSIHPTTGIISWMPECDQVGANAVTVRVRDTASGSDAQSFTVTVANVNDAPKITSTAVTSGKIGSAYSYDVNATDPDAGDTLTYSLVTKPRGMSINATTGVISWIPTRVQAGANAVTVRVRDADSATATQSYTIAVSKTNRAPTITSTPVTAATEDGAYTYDVNATDPDAGDTLTYSLVTAPNGMTINSTTGVISWTPTNAQVGANSVSVRVRDAASASATQNFTVTVANVNDAPTITSTAVTAGKVGTAYSYDVNATDPDAGDTLTYSLTTAPSGMSINSSTGVISWTPTSAQVGSNAVTVRVRDAASASATQSYTISVSSTNGAPSITSTPVTAATEDSAYTYDVNATDPDAGDALTYSLVTKPTGMSINATTGVISWTPTNAQVGANAVTVRVQDAASASATQSYTVTVANVNDAPTITSTAVTSGKVGTAYSYDVNATDPDAGDTLTYSLATAPSGMTINATTGVISWTPTSAQAGANAVTVRVRDAASASATQNFTVTVSATTSTPIPELALWESQMLQWANYHGTRLLNGTYGVDETYYDAQRVYQQIAEYTGDASWLAVADRAQKIYVENYVITSGAKVPGYWIFTHGLTNDYLATGDVQAKEWAIKLSQLASYAPDGTPLEWTAPADKSREVAYNIMAYINAERLGEAHRARLDALMEQALGHCTQWFTQGYEGAEGMKPFMFGLTAEALIYYYTYVNQDPRIITQLQLGAEWIWNNSWVSGDESFYYSSFNPSSGSPDLNMLIAPLYSWLYLQTGDTMYRDQGDQVFAGGVRHAYLGGSKQFNQNYHWSFDYIKYRNLAE